MILFYLIIHALYLRKVCFIYETVNINCNINPRQSTGVIKLKSKLTGEKRCRKPALLLI